MAFQLVSQVTPTQLTNAGQTSFAGPLADLDSPDFDYTLYSYPIIENPDYPDKSHAVIFYINIPASSSWVQSGQISTNAQGAVANRVNNNASLFGLRSPQDQGLDFLSNEIQQGVAAVLSSKTVRTTAAISLYVPNTMIWSQHAQYENVSVSAALGVFGDLFAAAGLMEEGKYGPPVAAIASMLPSATAGLKKALGLTGGGIGGGLRNLALAGFGVADNPQNFLLFKQMDFRKFQFDFILTPETPQEASIINQIIYLFRFHHAPEVLTGSLGRFFIPPSEFDIQFTHNGQNNLNLPSISTCILNSVNVDYAAAGHWSTTYDGVPQQIRLTLNFTEKSILTKDLIQQGF